MRLPLGSVEEDDDGVVDGVREDRSEEDAGLPKADRGGDAFYLRLRLYRAGGERRCPGHGGKSAMPGSNPFAFE